MNKSYQVSEVAAISGVSIRALHYYDSIGLLVPSRRTDAGYRLYSDADLLRLQQILISREFGLSLEDIREYLDDPKFDRRRALREQREQLLRRAKHTVEMIRAIDAALLALDNPDAEGKKMTDMKQLFNGFDPARYEAEVEQRWGNTEAYRISRQRTDAYTEKDWQTFKEEAAAIYGDAYAALQSGKRPEDPAVMAIAERHRLSIDRWFYPCSVNMHSGLADMYEADKRFADTIDQAGPGLTPFLAAAIRANARR
jgi:DNA-binding transcriptional MerR regulator